MQHLSSWQIERKAYVLLKNHVHELGEITLGQSWVVLLLNLTLDFLGLDLASLLCMRELLLAFGRVVHDKDFLLKAPSESRGLKGQRKYYISKVCLHFMYSVLKTNLPV